MTHDFSVLRGAVFLKFISKSYMFCLLFFFLSSQRDKCGAAAVAGFFQVFFLFAHTRQENLEIQCIIKMAGSILCVTISSGIPQVMCHFLVVYSSPPPPVTQ